MTTPRTPRLRRPAAALVALVVATLGSVALGVSPAAAHASLVSSTPADGASLDAAPRQVALTFSEEIREPAFVALTDADGTDVTSGKPGVDGAEVTRSVDTEALAAGGTVTLAYRVVSADGHPIEGELTFDVAAAPEPSPSASPEPTEPSGAAEPSDAADTSTPEPTEAATEPASQETDGGFWATNGTVVVIGVGVLLAVVALLLVGRRRGNGAE